jgi:hypothetical protein
MNNIAASLLYHTDEVFAFELLIRALNDYHLKEVHMPKFPGVDQHCEALEKIIAEKLPDLAAHFAKHHIAVIMFTLSWILSLFTQVVPLGLTHRFFTLYWQEEWVAFYRVVLAVLVSLQPKLLKCDNTVAIQLAIQESYALKI